MRIGAIGRGVALVAVAVLPLWSATAPASLGSGLPEDGWHGLSSWDYGPPLWDEEAPDTDTLFVPWELEPQVDDTPGAIDCPRVPGEAPAAADPEPESHLATPSPDSQQPSDPSPATTGRYLLCGDPDPLAEQAIEQLIAGRSFSSRLIGRPDGCADLTITVSPQSSPGSFIGRQSVGLTVMAGSGSGAQARPISLRITTENGTTRASIGAAR